MDSDSAKPIGDDASMGLGGGLDGDGEDGGEGEDGEADPKASVISNPFAAAQENEL